MKTDGIKFFLSFWMQINTCSQGHKKYDDITDADI